MLVASDLHRDSLSRPWLWLFVAFRFHFRYTFVSPSLSGWNRRCHGVRGNLDQNRTIPKLEPRSKPKPKTQNPWTHSVWNHSKRDSGNSQRNWMPFHNPCRLCGPTWRTCPQRSTDYKLFSYNVSQPGQIRNYLKQTTMQQETFRCISICIGQHNNTAR